MQRKPLNTYNRAQRWPGPAYWIILFVTLVLLVALTMTFFIALAVTKDIEKNVDPNGGDSTEGIVNNTTATGDKTGIVLPSATVSGNYLSTNASGFSQIEGITSEAAVLVEVGSKTAVAGKNADVVIHPASMTKVMTLLVACENLTDPNELLTVKQEMLDRRTQLDGSGEIVDNTTVMDPDGDTEKIQGAGISVTVEDALYLINYQSDTVACLMIAEKIAGSEAEFVKLMNKKAQEIGLTKTNFVNCTGLTEVTGEYNTTTCREMAAILNCALNNVVAKKIISSTAKYYADVYTDGQKTGYTIPFFADWHNRAARLNGNVKAGKVTILGGKTGYEDIPTSCFITYGTSSANGKTYVCVIVGRLINSGSPLVYNATGTEDTRYIYKTYAN